MAMVAMWLQGSDAISAVNAKLLMIFIGLVAVSMVVQAVVQIAVSIKAGKALKDMLEIVEDFRVRVVPLIGSATQIGKTAETLLRETAPKVKVIADNLMETSERVRGSVEQIDKTISDANLRTQRQVARVDGMVTAALTTTAELAETIQHGIQVPARKIAALASQVRYGLEGLLAKVRSMADGSGTGR